MKQKKRLQLPIHPPREPNPPRRRRRRRRRRRLQYTSNASPGSFGRSRFVRATASLPFSSPRRCVVFRLQIASLPPFRHGRMFFPCSIDCVLCRKARSLRSEWRFRREEEFLHAFSPHLVLRSTGLDSQRDWEERDNRVEEARGEDGVGNGEGGDERQAKGDGLGKEHRNLRARGAGSWVCLPFPLPLDFSFGITG